MARNEIPARVVRLHTAPARRDGTVWAVLNACLIALLILGMVHEIQQLTDRLDELDRRLQALERQRGKYNNE